MKYCVKCGNALQDDMIFCPKCGTEYIEIVSNDIHSKIKKLKEYQLALNASDISWNYIKDNAEKAGEISSKQDQLTKEVKNFITEIFSEVTDENKDLIEREIYTYVLQSATQMCDASAILLGNWSEFQELFNQGNELVKKGLLDPAKFLNQMHQCDTVYVMVALSQGFLSAELKKTLNPDVIANNLEYQEMTKELAVSFVNSMDKYVEREHKHFFSIGEPSYEAQRKLYDIFIAGLPQKIIDTIDKKPWREALDYMEENHNGGTFKKKMLDKEEKEDDARRNREQKITDEKYWAKHPKEYQLMLSKQEEIKKNDFAIYSIETKVNQFEKERKPFLDKKEKIENRIYEQNECIEKLHKKIFGKEKAKKDILWLENQMQQLKKENNENESDILKYERKINDKNNEINVLRLQIKELEQDIFNLRNKS